MKNTILTAAICLFSFVFTLKVEAADFEQIYIFGDSYSDDVNYYKITKSELGIGIPPTLQRWTFF